jgi:hypothetical protein
MAFQPITTQEELDELIERRLQRARAQWERESGIADAKRERDEARQRAARAERDAHSGERVAGVRDRDRQDLILKLADLSGVEAGQDGDPNPKQITDSLKRLHKTTPEVFGEGATVADAAPEGDGTGGEAPLTRERIEAMSPNEINSMWDRVQAFLSGERN